MIRKGVTSEEHNKCIELICIKWNLKPVIIRGSSNIRGEYFPDATNENTDYEVEVIPRKNYILKKSLKWDPKRKKVLILQPNTFAYEKFNEIYINNGKELIKIK